MKSPKIILDLQSNQWVLRNQDGDWEIPFSSDATSLSGFIPVEVLEKPAPDEEIAIQGKAYLYSTEGLICTVELLNHDAKRTQIEIKFRLNDVEDKGKIDFFEGFHDDGWIETETFAALTNVSALGLRFSIPAHDSAGSKTVTFQGDGAFLRVCDLDRNEIREVWLNFDKNVLQNELKINSSYDEPDLQDERALGISLREININLTDWVPYESFFSEAPHD